MDKKNTRRDFLKKSSAAGLSLASLSTIAPSSVLGANDRIRMGVIGAGGRGQWGLNECLKRGVQMVALCDVYEERFNQAQNMIQRSGGSKADQYWRHEEIIERNDIDAFYIAVPDHWHHDVLIDTVQAGKDAYVEKPFSRTIEEGKNMVKEVRKTNQVVQVGNHRRSGKHWLKARDWVQSGKLGKIVWVKVYDTRNWSNGDPFGPRPINGRLDWDRFLGTAPKRPFDPYRYFGWRWFWDYAGGHITDIGAHQLDVNQWVMGVDGPETVMCHGGKHFFKAWETPDVIHSILNYGSFTTLFTVEFVNDADNVGATFYGSNGTLKVNDRDGFRVYIPQGATEPVDQWERPYEGGDHVANFLECIKSRKEPNSPVETGHKVITAAHLSNISFRSGKRIHWDAQKEEIIDV